MTTYRGPAAFTNPWPAGPITIRFDADGTISGSSGCNDYSGSFEVEGGYHVPVEGVARAEEGQVIRFGSTPATTRAWENESVMEQETENMPLLPVVGRWVIDGDTLVLNGSDGSLLIEARPAG